jgi:hypothetical protein
MKHFVLPIGSEENTLHMDMNNSASDGRELPYQIVRDQDDFDGHLVYFCVRLDEDINNG